MQKRIIILLLFLIINSLPSQAKSITGDVIKITDGDTLTIITGNSQQEKISNISTIT